MLCMLCLLTILFYQVQRNDPNVGKQCNSFLLPRLKTMADIEQLLPMEKCGQLSKLFSLYHIEVEGVPITIPLTFRKKVSGWLGGNEILLEQAQNQKVIQITSK